MRSIWKIAWANLRHRKGSLFGVMFLLALLTLSYAITLNNNSDLIRAVDQTIAAYDTGDLIVFTTPDIPESFYRALDQNQSIRSYRADTELCIDRDTIVNGKKTKQINLMIPYTQNSLIVNSEKHAAVQNTQPPEPGSVYLSYDLKQYKIGSQIRIQLRGGRTVDYTVQGYFQSVLHSDAMMLSDSDFRNLLANEADDLFSNDRYLWDRYVFHLFTENGTDLSALRKELHNLPELGAASISMHTKDDISEDARVYTSIGSRVVAVYVILLISVVLIVIGTSINAAIEDEYVNIGILKSQGFGKWRLRVVWIIQYTAAEICGTVLGLILSIPATKVLGGVFFDLASLTGTHRIAFGKCALAAFTVLIICIGFVIAATAKIDKISPVRAINGGHADIYFDSRLHVPIRKQGLSFFVALRQVITRRRDYLSCLLIVAILTFFMSTVMLMSRGLNASLIHIPTGDIELTMLGGQFKTDQAPELLSMCRQYDPDAELILWTARNIGVEDEQYMVEMFSDEESFDPPLEGRLPKYDNEILITQTVSRAQNKKIGDSITVSFEGQRAEYVITGYCQTVMNFGLVCEMSFGGGSRIGVNSPDIAFVKMKDLSARQDLCAALNTQKSDVLSAQEIDPRAAIQNILDLIETFSNLLIYAVYVISFLFAVVVVSMICRVTFLRERKDIGIFRSIGFSNVKLRIQFALRFILIALLGSALGCGISVLFSRRTLSAVMKTVGITRFKAETDPFVYLIPILIICTAFFLFSYISSRAIKKVSVRELVNE